MNQTPHEHDEQKALMKWAEWADKQLEKLKLLHAIPNGGQRNKVTAAKLKAEGVKPGVPDLSLPVARGKYHGLYIELKRRKGGRVSDEQKWWIVALKAEGYQAEVCHGFDEAKQVILDYLSLPATGPGKE